ncbi:MAG: UDPglucose 6-dehydrogenase, partial [Porticoccaceae bacterium]
MKITIIGSGYVGLVSGTCFSEMGNKVTCVDVDSTKISDLKNGIIPIYEPGLELMVQKNIEKKNLFFTTDVKRAIQNCKIVFIAVGTPMGDDGSADLQYVLEVAKSIGKTMQQRLVVVNKSTVPVGTADKVKETIQNELDNRGASIEFDVVSNP